MTKQEFIESFFFESLNNENYYRLEDLKRLANQGSDIYDYIQRLVEPKTGTASFAEYVFNTNDMTGAAPSSGWSTTIPKE